MDINCPCMRVKRILQYITQRTKRESQDFTQYKFSWCLNSNAVGGSVRFLNCQQVACAAWPWDSLQKRPALWKVENHQMIFEKRPISQHSTLLLHLPIGSLHFLAAESRSEAGPPPVHRTSSQLSDLISETAWGMSPEPRIHFAINKNRFSIFKSKQAHTFCHPSDSIWKTWGMSREPICD